MIDDPAPRRGRTVSIRAKILAAASILLVGSTLLYGYVAFTTARDALLPSIREQLADDAVNVKGGLEEMLTAHFKNVHTWARLDLMGELATGDQERTVADFLESVSSDYGVYLSILAIDGNGVCLASSRPADVGRSFAGTPVANGAPAGAARPRLEYSADHQAAYIRLAAPIPDPTQPGRDLGTLVAMLDREVLDRIVVSKPGHSQVELRLLDGGENLVAGRESPLKIEQVADWRVGEGENPDVFPTSAPPLLREGREASGRSFIVATVPIGHPDSLPTPGWHLVASVPKDRALAPVAAVRDQVLVTGIALIVSGLLAATWFAHLLTRPINDLTDVAARIARSGDLETVPPPTTNDEVGELALAFQHMVSALAAANDEMVRTSKLAFLGEMAAGMAHEIRTPLGIIRNSAQLLERRMAAAGDGEAAEWAVFIREESDRLARVVTELLDFVKPVPPCKSDIDLGALVRRAATLLATEAETRGVLLAVEAPDVPVVVPCDADQIHQVCLNLMMNALQASPRGSQVRVAVENRGDRAAIVVRDRGSGIPGAIAERLFEPFTSQKDGGIGLGLAIVRRLVRAHGGEVMARNRRGGGAKFAVLLPFAAGETGKESHAT